MKKISYDKIAKALFNELPFIITTMFNDIYNLNIDINNDKIELINSEHPITKINEMKKISDIIIKVNDDIILNLEVNSEAINSIKLRNFIYLVNLFILSKKKGMNYNEINKGYVYQININSNERKDVPVIKYKMMDTLKHKIYINNVNICNINVDKCYDLLYNGCIKDKHNKKYRWGALFKASTLDEINNIIGGDLMSSDLKDKTMHKLDFLNNGDFWDADRYEITDEEYIEEIKEEYESRGQASIIENMLKKNLDIDMISEYSGLPKKNILNIKNNMAI